MKKLLKFIKENYQEGEPIFLKDLKKLNISYDNLRQKIKKLSDLNLIIRITDGIYSYGKEADKLKIIETRFIRKDLNTFGYYNDKSLLNMLGFDLDNDYYEITTNNFKAIVRKIEMLGVKIKIRHSKIEINNENCYVLEFLDLIKSIDKYKLDLNKLKETLNKYILEHNINKNIINKYINLYPNVIYKNYYKYDIISMLN